MRFFGGKKSRLHFFFPALKVVFHKSAHCPQKFLFETWKNFMFFKTGHNFLGQQK